MSRRILILKKFPPGVKLWYNSISIEILAYTDSNGEE